MPRPEWVPVYDAIGRLAVQWCIDHTIAEGVVRRVMESGMAQVRAEPLGSIIPKLVTKEIGALLPREPLSLIVPMQWRNVEIDWNGLVANGRDYLPNWIQVPEQRAISLREAIAEQLEAGMKPGTNVTWADFCNEVRDRTRGWSQDHKPKRGHSNRTIQRVVDQLKNARA